VQGVALDGRILFYATNTALHRMVLPRRGTTEPPANDDFESATPLTIDRYVIGRIGHATRQPGEPGAADRSVWYRFQAPTTETLRFYVFGDVTEQVFVGSAMSDLAPVLPVAHIPLTIDVVAGQTYWIEISSSGPYPTCEPLRIGLSRGDYEPG
jgi:hypothetical protein